MEQGIANYGFVLSVESRLSAFIGRVIDIFYIDIIARHTSKTTFRYAACGVANYLVLDPILYYIIYNYVVGHKLYDIGFIVISPHILAMILLFPIILFTGFWLNRHIAFEATGVSAHSQVLKYLFTIAGSLLMSYVLMKLLVDVCGLWPTPSKVITTLTTAIYSYLAARYFTFKRGRAGGVQTENKQKDVII